MTLTGAGGCGKTRLAFAVGASLADASLGEGKPRPYADGIWLVEFASLADPSLVPQRLASTLDVREQAGQSLLATLTNSLRDKHLLLILDNCEHLIEACARLAESLLQTCPHLQILATSREALNIAGETIFLVPSLQSPTSHVPCSKSSDDMGRWTSDIGQYEAVRLFVERAQSAQPHFVLTDQNAFAIARICHQLDGIPLAIELAAARVKALSVEQIAARLDDIFHLLTGGSRTALPRHQTLRAAIDWSYDLLSEPERVLFRRLSVFAGGWTLEAVEAVCGDGVGAGLSGLSDHAPAQTRRLQELPLPQSDVLDLLTQLVNKSLVLAEERDGETRYRMLETIRQHAQQKLSESGEEQDVRARHLDYFTQFAEEANRNLHAPDQARWFDRLETEHDNLRAAMDWSLAHAQVATGFRLAAVLNYFWFTRDHLSEGLDRLARFLARPEMAARTPARARALTMVADYQGGNQAKQRALAEEALAIGREVRDDEIVFWALSVLTTLATRQRDYAEARSWLAQMLPIVRESGDKLRIRVSNTLQADILFYEGELEKARMLHEESAALMREVNDKGTLGREVRRLGTIAFHQGIYDNAIAFYRESLHLNLELDDKRGAAACLAGLAAVALAQGQATRAARLFAAVEALLEAIPMEFQYFDQDEYDRNVAVLHAQLDEGTLAQAWAEGRALTLEQAIAEAEQVSSNEQPTQPQTEFPAGLTAREVEVLRLLSRGLTDAEIAETLVVSPRTVNSHLRSIYSKLDVTTRTAAARIAMEYKLV